MKPKLKYYFPTNLNLTKSIFIKLLLVSFIIFYIWNVSAVPPTISIVNNSKTNTSDSYGIYLLNSQVIIFNASTTDNTNTWNWYQDGILQINNNPSFTTAFSSGSYHYVQLNTTNIDGTSNNLTWGINVAPEMATSSNNIPTLNETPATNFNLALKQKDMPKLVGSSQTVYLNLIGLSYYAFVWFIVFGMMWIKQSSINIPAVIGIIFGGIIITFLPSQYQLVSQVLIVFGIFAVIYIFFKGRG